MRRTTSKKSDSIDSNRFSKLIYNLLNAIIYSIVFIILYRVFLIEYPRDTPEELIQLYAITFMLMVGLNLIISFTLRLILGFWSTKFNLRVFIKFIFGTSVYALISIMGWMTLIFERFPIIAEVTLDNPFSWDVLKIVLLIKIVIILIDEFIIDSLMGL